MADLNLSRSLPLLASALLAGAAASAQGTTCYDFAAVDAIGAQIVQSDAQNGAVIWLHKSEEDLYSTAFGGYAEEEVVAIASATKWLTAACLLTLVDDGLVSLDEPVATYLPVFAGQPGAAMTLRQMLSHTSGLPGNQFFAYGQQLTLEESVDFIALQVPLLAPPGTQFVYGGLSMQVAGRVAEVVTGQTWADLFEARIAMPMGMDDTDYTGLGVTANPRIAGGARSSAADYGTFLRMIAERGWHRDGVQVRQILSAAAIDEMLRDQTGGVPIVSTPQPDDRRYGLGCWIDRVEPATGDALQFSSQGAFGFSPWFDIERDLLGIVLVQSALSRVRDDVEALQLWSRDTVHFAGVRCFGSASPSCEVAMAFGTNRPPRAGEAGFELRVAAAPPSTAGALLLGDLPIGPGLTLLGADFYVTGAALASVPVVSAADGTLAIPVSLVNTAAGGPFFLQLAWASACGVPGQLSASPAIRLFVAAP